MTATKRTTKPRSLPWGRYADAVDRQIAAANVTPEQLRAVYLANSDATGAPVVQEFFQPKLTTRSVDIPVGRQAVVVNGASEKQAKFIDDLLVEREHIIFTEELIADIKADWRKTRKLIDLLLAAPRVQRTPAPASLPVTAVTPAAPARARLDFSAIPDGNYAIREDGVVKFYRVSTKRGYKNVQVRASDELHMVFGSPATAILHRIVEAGLAESRMLFVTELGRCCKCGRSLTDEESRSNARVNGGYGPDCAGK